MTPLREIPGTSTVTADDYKRVRIPDAKPGQVFVYELSGNVVKLTPLKPVEEDVPVVKAVRRPDGTYRFPDKARPNRKEILRYLRADRDRGCQRKLIGTPRR